MHARACRSSGSTQRRTAVACALAALSSLAGCTAKVGDSPSDGLAAGGTSSVGAGSSTGAGPAAGTSTGGSGSTVARGIDLPGEPKFFRFVRLTNSQWANSVKDVLKLAAPSGLEVAFQGAVSGTTDFRNNELLLDVNQRGWADYQGAAEALAEQVTASDAALSAVYPGTDAAGFIQTVGRRAYRRPLTEPELTKYQGLFDTGKAMEGSKSPFAKGAALVIRALLQSPHFLYRSELGDRHAPLSGFEVAAKLSLWLRDTTPSDALLDEAGTLTSPAAIATEASEMMNEPAAGAVMREFHRELLHFDRYAQISKLGVPAYAESLNAEYQESSYLFFDRIFGQGLGLREILTSTQGFVGPAMAKLYGSTSSGSGFVEQDLGPARAGFFSQLPYLTLNALNDEPDSIHRGVSINLDVLCAPLGPPVAMLPPVPALKPGQTNRERITTLTQGCGGVCHNELINPLGFAFEHFDGMGQYRETEGAGLAIDSSGSYTFSEGEKTFQDAAGMMQAVAESEQAHLCYSKKLASFGLQRDVVAADMPWLGKLSEVSRGQGGSVKKVLVELVKSDAFRTHAGGSQ
ncbi:MAG: DUF1592 domain-containing protein [Myxococcales bacterium]|nr:MAG: DUF1592 domain-containing protein [Myxococcales bacterium]